MQKAGARRIDPALGADRADKGAPIDTGPLIYRDRVHVPILQLIFAASARRVALHPDEPSSDVLPRDREVIPDCI